MHIVGAVVVKLLSTLGALIAYRKISIEHLTLGTAGALAAHPLDQSRPHGTFAV
jgi:hypothetical protein